MLAPIPLPSGSGLRLLIDLNETLIRTGTVPLAERIREQIELEEFAQQCRRLAAELSLEVVFLTGNSFEYSRRIEEPLGLKEIPGLSLVIVSENGLVARSFQGGDLWRAETLEPYRKAVSGFLHKAAEDPVLRGIWYSQGNEVRTTLKPIANAFNAEQKERWQEVTRGLADVATVYLHRFYLDLDPREVILDGRRMEFTGKAYAASRLARKGKDLTIAVGDSASDLPMFSVVRSAGGLAFWVGPGPEGGAEEATRVAEPFTAGVNLILRSVAVE